MFFFFNDTATTEIYTLSLHDALPISAVWTSWGSAVNTLIAEVFQGPLQPPVLVCDPEGLRPGGDAELADRKSTRLNSSHANISYAVFCLKKKNKTILTLYLWCLI